MTLWLLPRCIFFFFTCVAVNLVLSDENFAAILCDSRGQQFPAMTPTLPESGGGSREQRLPLLLLFMSAVLPELFEESEESHDS